MAHNLQQAHVIFRLTLGLSAGAIALLIAQFPNAANLEANTKRVLAISLAIMLASLLLSLIAILQLSTGEIRKDGARYARRGVYFMAAGVLVFTGGLTFGCVEVILLLLR